jgi:TrbL/VirB6 plasmid conjugal transfer protein
MFQVLPDTSQLPTVDVNFLNDYVLNPIIEQLDAGFDRLRGTMNVGIGVCLTLAISEFAYALIIGAEHFAGGLRRLLGISVWLYIIRDYSHHAHALMNSLVNVGMVFGGSGGNWRETLNPSRIAAKGFELGAVLLDNMPNGFTLDLGDILGVGIGFVLIQACFGALVLNVGLLVIGFYMALPIAGFFSIFGLLSQTRGFAMRGITAIVSYGVHFALAALSLTLSESVIRGLHFSPEPTMHEIWAMVFVVMLLTVFAWWGPQRVAASFMNGAVGVGGGEAATIGAAVGGTAMAVATGVVGTAALGLDKIVQGLDNRPKESSGGGSGAAGGGGAPRVSQSIQPAPAAPVASAAPAQPHLPASPTQASAGNAAGPHEPILETAPTAPASPPRV